MGDVTTEHTFGRRMRHFKRIEMAWWVSGLAVFPFVWGLGGDTDHNYSGDDHAGSSSHAVRHV
jgi:hypothetical protein